MTEYTKASTINDLVRTILTTIIDRPGFWLLCVMYEIFFNVASAQIFSNATIKNFYYRIQLIIGVFMIFKLSIAVLEAIINPEKFTAKKTGTMSIVGRIFISLILLAILTPINIPNPQNSFEVELNNNGLLFGTLYSLQDRILANNTIGRIVLGTTDNDVDIGASTNDLNDAANKFASTILKVFVKINIVPEDQRVDDGSGRSPDMNSDNWVCPDALSQDVLDIYRSTDSSPQEILSLVNLSCESASASSGWASSAINKVISGIKKLAFSGTYAFAYKPLGGIVALIFAIILLGFSVDIAIRAIKLAVLRLIAPIPVISYMSPNGKDNGAFGTWVKSLTSTYLDLFIRLVLVYFILFLINDIIDNGLIIDTGNGIVGGISFILICLGLFLFAKQAPKFIKDALGMKGPGMSNFGLNAMLAGAGAIRAGGNVVDVGRAIKDSAQASTNAINQGKAPMGVGQGYTFGKDNVIKSITGNSNATYQQHQRGVNDLKRMGIYYKENGQWKDIVEDQWKAQKTAAERDAQEAQSIYDRFIKDAHKRDGASLTRAEKERLVAEGYATFADPTDPNSYLDMTVDQYQNALEYLRQENVTAQKKLSKIKGKIDSANKEKDKKLAERTYYAKRTQAMFGNMPYMGTGPYGTQNDFRGYDPDA